jgi:hypothetical protein
MSNHGHVFRGSLLPGEGWEKILIGIDLKDRKVSRASAGVVERP